MSSLMNRPAAAAAVITVASVVAALLVTALVMLALGATDLTMGLLLAGLLPAAMAPGPTYMLARSNARLRQLHHEMERQANTDQLTGLPNRRAFFARAPELLAEPRALVAGAAVMMIDIDHFKRVNDNHGHAVGDAMLREAAALLVTLFAADGAFVARLGGEEFAAIMPGSGGAAADGAAERVCRAFRRLAVVKGDPDGGHLTASVGIALTWNTTEIERALSEADAAVYLAKRAGRDRWVRQGAARAEGRGPRRPRHGGRAAA